MAQVRTKTRQKFKKYKKVRKQKKSHVTFYFECSAPSSVFLEKILFKSVESVAISKKWLKTHPFLQHLTDNVQTKNVQI